MELQEKDEDKEENHISKANQKEPKDNSYLRGPSIKSVLSNKTNKPPFHPFAKTIDARFCSDPLSLLLTGVLYGCSYEL